MGGIKVLSPQINSLNSKGYLNIIVQDIQAILSRYSSVNQPLCSHSILGLASLQTIKIIAHCSKPNSSGYSIPAGWIGAVCSYMEKNNMLRVINRRCNFNGKIDPFWYI